jgi:glycine betaine/proline transport system substrate-binding protein
LDLKRSTIGRLAIGAATLSIALGACSGGGASTPAASTGSGGTAAKCDYTVNIADNAWVGYEADVAVIDYLLRNELGCKTKVKAISEQVGWEGFPTGEIDVILENWGHDDLALKYITTDKTAVDLGSQGNTGIIGWYVPKFYADLHPDILTADKDPKVLNKYAADFATSESGGKGQLLDGDPAYVTNDEALVANFGLNFKVVYSGSEAASDKSIKAAIDAKKPILAYYWEPNWFSTQVDMVQVKLPPYTAGCDADPKKVACDYPPYALNKIASKKFADAGGPAFTLVKNFKWTNADQNLVATDIALNKMSNDEAAKKWLDAHQDVWKAANRRPGPASAARAVFSFRGVSAVPCCGTRETGFVRC